MGYCQSSKQHRIQSSRADWTNIQQASGNAILTRSSHEKRRKESPILCVTQIA